jgi:hypothetical protein
VTWFKTYRSRRRNAAFVALAVIAAELLDACEALLAAKTKQEMANARGRAIIAVWRAKPALSGVKGGKD